MTPERLDAVANLLMHPLADRQRGHGTFDRLTVAQNGCGTFDVVLRIDGGYAARAGHEYGIDAETVLAHWQALLDEVLDTLASEVPL